MFIVLLKIIFLGDIIISISHKLKGIVSMLVYDGTKLDFLKSVEQDTIAFEIEENIKRLRNAI